MDSKCWYWVFFRFSEWFWWYDMLVGICLDDCVYLQRCWICDVLMLLLWYGIRFVQDSRKKNSRVLIFVVGQILPQKISASLLECVPPNDWGMLWLCSGEIRVEIKIGLDKNAPEWVSYVNGQQDTRTLDIKKTNKNKKNNKNKNKILIIIK